MLAERTKQSCMSYWYPILKKIPNIRTPKTFILKGVNRVPNDLFNILDGRKPKHWGRFIELLAHEISKLGKPPVFLRTGHTSNKHSWNKTCYLADMKYLEAHVMELIEFSANAGMLGLPVNVWVVREFLDIGDDNLMLIGYDGMPVLKERRYFIEKGKVVHRQPYWPKDAVRLGIPAQEGWEEMLADLNKQSVSEIKLLTTLSEIVGESFPEYWSVDWLNVKDKWYLTDMARGELSYRYEP